MLKYSIIFNYLLIESLFDSKCKFPIRTPLLDMNLQKYKLEHDKWKYPYKAKARNKSNDFYFETSQVPPVSELRNIHHKPHMSINKHI